MQRLGVIDWRHVCWVGFFAAILGAWGILFTLRPETTLPGAYWATLCRSGAGETSFAIVFAMWALMSVAMMAPTALPALTAYDDLTHTKAADSAGFVGVVAGYLCAWLGFSAVAAAVQMALAGAGALDAAGRSVIPWLNIFLLTLAGGYQFSSLKAACLAKCRSPLMFFIANWRDGFSGAIHMGLKLGVACIGCCWVLMLLAFVGGVMSLAWMGIAMVLMGLEKMPALGRYITRPLGGLLLIGALWMAAGAPRLL